MGPRDIAGGVPTLLTLLQPRHTTHSSSLKSTLQTRTRSGNPKEGLEDRIEESMHKTDQSQKNRRDHKIRLSRGYPVVCSTTFQR